MRSETKIALLLLVGILICELHQVVYFLFPQSATIQIDVWADKNYKEKITPLWYIYELTNILKNIFWVYAFQQAVYYSPVLIKVASIILIYYITQFVFYVWDRNTAFISNLIVYLYSVLGYLLIPDRKSGKLINIEDC